MLSTATTSRSRRRLTSLIVSALAIAALATTLLAPAASAAPAHPSTDVTPWTTTHQNTTRTLYNNGSTTVSPVKRTLSGNASNTGRMLYAKGTCPKCGNTRTLYNNGNAVSPVKRTLSGNAGNGARTLYGNQSTDRSVKRTLGSDATGDGSLANPYRSLVR